MKRHIRQLLGASVLGMFASVASTTAHAADEVNVLLFSMPYTQGLAKLADDFEAKTGIKANIEVVGQDVFENRITLTFAGQADDIDVVHTLSLIHISEPTRPY